MKTKIIRRNDWKTLKEYDINIVMSKGDVVWYEDLEYLVYSYQLNIDTDTIEIQILKA